ncbi:MAG: hypothetical protein HYY09_05205 [Firmicutes bacterium]|nr:hypothetical protein [Bacillota bacterium]
MTLIRSDYVLEGRGFRFQVRVLGKSAVTENVLTVLFDSGRYWGFGQFRTGGFGRFSYVIEKIP